VAAGCDGGAGTPGLLSASSSKNVAENLPKTCFYAEQGEYALVNDNPGKITRSHPPRHPHHEFPPLAWLGIDLVRMGG
jgi:hypothetical protein